MAAIRSSQKGPGLLAKDDNFRPPVYDYLDIPREKKDFIIEICETALRLLNNNDKKFYYECAEFIKKQVEEKFGGSFHVIVGRDFGAFFTYEAQHCVQFWINQHCFLVFKHG